MKVAKTFSLPIETINLLEEYCAIKKINTNMFLGLLIRKACRPEIIVCQTCNAKYSEKFKDCPNCKILKEDMEKKLKEDTENAGKVDMPTKQNGQKDNGSTRNSE